MAGNIIPAIATTNAIVAGMIVMLAFKVLSSQLGKCKYTYLSWGGGRSHLFMNSSLEKPSPYCAVCSNAYLVLKMNVENQTLGFLVDKVLMASGKGLGLEGEITIEESGRYVSCFLSPKLCLSVTDYSTMSNSMIIWTRLSLT
jgi:ubiquitin-like 1-activating enzyme E1 B